MPTTGTESRPKAVADDVSEAIRLGYADSIWRPFGPPDGEFDLARPSNALRGSECLDRLGRQRGTVLWGRIGSGRMSFVQAKAARQIEYIMRVDLPYTFKRYLCAGVSVLASVMVLEPHAKSIGQC
jgi:hypothetical protein